jgi:DNA-binding NarL/FixJ family response regulator
MKAPRILLADDHVLLSEAIKHLLQPEFEVVGTVADGQELLERAPKLKPDLIVLDIGMPKVNGLIAGERLKQMLPRVKLIYLTMNLDPDVAGEAFRLGASGYVVKNSAATELVRAIREVLRGGSYVTPFMTQDMVGSFVQNIKRRRPTPKLTLRQKEVLQLLAEGRSMKEVAFALKVTPRTVAFHKYSMMEHLRLRSSAELIQFAIKTSMVAA